MSEIEAVSGGVATAFKGKKGVYLVVGVAVVGVVAMVLRSRSSAGTATVAASDSGSSSSGLAALGNSMQQSNAALQAHIDDNNATLSSGISAIATQSGNQDSEIKALQDQMTAALANETSMVNSIGSLAQAATDQARQNAAQNASLLDSLGALTSAQAAQATQSQQQNSSLMSTLASLLARISGSSGSSSSGSSGGYPSTPTPTPTPTPAPQVVKTIFGASADLVAALSRWGGRSGYNFIDTTGMDQNALASQLRAAGQNGLIVGGINAGGGVSAAASNGTGVVRVAGNDAAATAAAINSINF